MSISEAQEILEFWFGDAADGNADALEAAFGRWFAGGSEFDEKIRNRFGETVEIALAGGLREWEQNVRSRLALIILLDQFPRNIFRRTAGAFAGDSRALALARATVEQGEDRKLTVIERVFLLMPYQHAESMHAQEESISLFAELADAPGPAAARGFLRSSLKYARQHHEIIARFGRYPHRNTALGRASTPAETAWLEASGARFGQ